MKAYRLIAAIALGGLMACGPFAKAQTNTPPSSNGGRGGRGGPNFQAIFDQLNLSDDQKTKIKTVMDDSREKMMALRNDSSLSREDRQTKMKDIRDANDAKLKDILTPDQYTKYLDLRKQQMSHRRGGGSGGSGGTGSTPPPTSGNQ